MKEFIQKYKRYVLIFLLSVSLGATLYFGLLFGIWAKGAFKWFFADDESAGYICRHLYLISILFSLASLIIVCLFNKIEAKMKFISVYASICHIVIYVTLTIISYYVSKTILPFFSNIIWLIFSFTSVIIFAFTLFMAIKNKDELIAQEEKENSIF